MSTPSLYLSASRYLAALKRQLGRIKGGLGLRAVDDTTPGDKSTTCTWGLCSDEKEAWPDAKDHLWPDQFEKYGRVAPKYRRTDNQLCPLDYRIQDPSFPPGVLSQGCWFSCRVFNPRNGDKRPDTEQAIRFYKQRIASVGEKPHA